MHNPENGSSGSIEWNGVTTTSTIPLPSLQPFEVVYSYLHFHPAPYEYGIAKVELVEQQLVARDMLLSLLKTILKWHRIE